jgi:hypothetical protein
MTIEQAFDFFKSRYNRTKDYNDIHWEASEYKEHREYVEALSIAVEAILMQIPAEIGFDQYGCYIYHCPICHNPINKRNKYCSECGKALTWKTKES